MDWSQVGIFIGTSSECVHEPLKRLNESESGIWSSSMPVSFTYKKHTAGGIRGRVVNRSGLTGDLSQGEHFDLEETVPLHAIVSLVREEV